MAFFFSWASASLFLLSCHHLLTFPLRLLHRLLLLLGLGLPLLLLLSLQLQLLRPLLLSCLLLLLGSDLLPLGLFLLQPLQLLLLLGPLVSPLSDVVLQLSVKLILLGLDIVRSHGVRLAF